MTDRKTILSLMSELAQNPSTRKAYRQNPQAFLNQYNFSGETRTRLLNRDAKGLGESYSDGAGPFVLQQDFFGQRPVFIGTIKGIIPHYT